MKSYQLEKFENGPVFFVKRYNEQDNTTCIYALVNIVEIRDQAEYKLTIILCKNYDVNHVSIHGAYLSLENILQIVSNLIDKNPNIYEHIVRN
jgi:hypothetical protein